MSDPNITFNGKRTRDDHGWEAQDEQSMSDDKWADKWQAEGPEDRNCEEE